MIITFYFIFQYILTYDTNTFYFLIGLFITIIIITGLGYSNVIQKYKNLDVNKYIPEYCNLLLLTKNGPLSVLSLSQAMFGYILFFILYIIFKYGLMKQNFPYMILFTTFIAMDYVWNYQNNCTNSSLMILAFTLGAAFGLLFAYVIDKSKYTDLTKFQNLDRSKDKCVFNKSKNKFVCYGKPDKI
jgi:hypothetical protein